MDRKGVDVKCPFWHWYDDRTMKISCEGGGGVYVHTLKFKSKVKMEIHKQRYCEGNCEGCPYHTIIMQKYDGEDAAKEKYRER